MPTHWLPCPCVGERHIGCHSRLHVRAGVGQFSELLPQRFGIVEHDAGPVIEMTPPDTRRPCHVRQQRLRGGAIGGKLPAPFVEPCQVAPRKIPDRALRLAGQRQETGPAPIDLSIRQRMIFVIKPAVRAEILLQHDMGIRPGYSEGVHPR